MEQDLEKLDPAKDVLFWAETLVGLLFLAVIVLGAIGLGALSVYLDMVLLPILVIFLGITGFAVYQKSRQDNAS